MRTDRLADEQQQDQASSLRRIVAPSPVQVIAVTSGKGGVGKTNVSVNLSLSLAAQDKKVLLMDADLGLANVDVMLGLQPAQNLSHVIAGTHSLEEVIVEGPGGIRIIPASSGIKDMAELNAAQHAGVIRAFSELGFGLDVLVVDTAAGISDSVVSFSAASHEVIVVVCDEPASITDAYALIKVLNQAHAQNRFRILVNQTHNPEEGRQLFLKLARVTDRFLDVSLDFMGVVPYDGYLRKAVKRQKPVVQAYPSSRSSMAFKELAVKADKWSVPSSASGQLEFFIERLVQMDSPEMRAQA